MKRWIPLFLSILLIGLATIGYSMAGVGGWHAGEFRASLRRKR